VQWSHVIILFHIVNVIGVASLCDIETIMICAACVWYGFICMWNVQFDESKHLLFSARCYSFARQAVIESDSSQSDSFVVWWFWQLARLIYISS